MSHVSVISKRQLTGQIHYWFDCNWSRWFTRTWRCQLWGTGAHAPSTSNWLIFSGHFRAAQSLKPSTLATIVAEFGDSRRFWRQSPFSATVAEIGDYSRQCGQGLTLDSIWLFSSVQFRPKRSYRPIALSLFIAYKFHNILVCCPKIIFFWFRSPPRTKSWRRQCTRSQTVAHLSTNPATCSTPYPLHHQATYIMAKEVGTSVLNAVLISSSACAMSLPGSKDRSRIGPYM